MTENGPTRRQFVAGTALSITLPIGGASAAAQPPGPGASWWFFRSGTRLPAMVYADPELKDVIGPQVAYGKDGLPPFFLDPKLSYRAMLVQSDGTKLADLDPLNDPAQGLLFTLPAGPEAVTRPLQEHAREVVTLGDHASLADGQAAIDVNEALGRGIAVRGRTPGVVRSLQTLVNEGVSLTKDFAVTEGQLSTAGIRNAIETASGEGFTLHVPGGQFRFDEPVTGRLNDEWLSSPEGMRKAAIVGAGANVTEFLFLGDPDQHAIAVEAAGFPNSSNLRLKGFRVHRPDGGPGAIASAKGSGIHLKDLIQFTLSDVQAFRHGIGLLITGCLRGHVQDFSFTYNRINVRLQRGQHSDTNVLRMSGGSLNSGMERGLQALGGAQIHVSDFTMDGIGAENARPETARGFELSEMGSNGGCAAHIDHGYFERNRGVEIEIIPGIWPANYAITHCNFNRVGPGRDERPVAGIRFSGNREAVTNGGPKSLLDLSGTAFDGYDVGQGYGVEPSRPYLDIDLPRGVNALTLIDRAARYGHPEEVGRIPAEVRRNPA